MKIVRWCLVTLLSLFCFTGLHARDISYSVERIWGDGTWHCAFPSIVEFKGRYFISFREFDSHIFNKEGEAAGRIRIISSRNGRKWENVALISKEGYDLRDPKLSVTPDNRLAVIMGGSVYRNKKLVACEPHVMFSDDGKEFSAPEPVLIEESTRTTHDWLWRITWHEGTAYGVKYCAGGKNDVYLYKTSDGVKYDYVSSIPCDGFPNETTVRMLPDGEMALMIRRDKGDRCNIWATARPPFKEWKTVKTGSHIGGPDFIVLEGGQIIAGGRTHFMGKPQTTLLTGDNAGNFVEKITLPSSGDNSYPGFLLVKDEIWVTYYSCHETKRPSIFLAKIPVELFIQ